MAAVSEAEAEVEPKVVPPADEFARQMDALHILPLKIIPFENSVLKSARLIKN